MDCRFSDARETFAVRGLSSAETWLHHTGQLEARSSAGHAASRPWMRGSDRSGPRCHNVFPCARCSGEIFLAIFCPCYGEYIRNVYSNIRKMSLTSSLTSTESLSYTYCLFGSIRRRFATRACDEQDLFLKFWCRLC